MMLHHRKFKPFEEKSNPSWNFTEKPVLLRGLKEDVDEHGL